MRSKSRSFSISPSDTDWSQFNNRGMKTVFAALLIAVSAGAQDYLICVSNEKAGTISFVDAKSQNVETVSVGKRPRGIHASPDGKYLFVAVSGTPIKGPPKLDAQGNPIFEDDDEDQKNTDHSADESRSSMSKNADFFES